jgi:hypothetical protein
MAANINVVNHAGAGNIGKVAIMDCSATVSGTGLMWRHTGTGTVPAAISYIASTANGVAL